MNTALIISIAGALGVSTIMGILLKYILEKRDRSNKQIKDRVDLLKQNVFLIESFNKRIMDLEVQVLNYRKDREAINKNRDELVEVLNNLEDELMKSSTVSESELTEFKVKINNMRKLLQYEEVVE